MSKKERTSMLMLAVTILAFFVGYYSGKDYGYKEALVEVK